MSLDERLANFAFLYDEDGPHLNPHILEKLKPKQNDEINQETESRLSPDLPSLLVGPVDKPTDTLQSQGSTLAGKKTKALRTNLRMGKWQIRGKGHKLLKKKLNITLSSKEMLQLQPASQ